MRLYRIGSNREEKRIECGDAMWIVYTEISSCIAFNPGTLVSAEPKQKMASQLLKQQSNRDCIYFDQGDATNPLYNNSTGLWRIESATDSSSGKELSVKEHIRFKNINTGKYLQMAGADANDTLCCGLEASESPSELGVFYLDYLEDASGEADSTNASSSMGGGTASGHSLFRIVHAASKRYVGK